MATPRRRKNTKKVKSLLSRTLTVGHAKGVKGGEAVKNKKH